VAKNLRFEGIKELDQVLAALSGDKALSNKVAGQILRKAEKPIVEEARRLVPVGEGDTKKSIGGIAGRGQGRGTQRYIGPRRGGPFKGYAGHLIEYGTAPRRKKNGQETGSMPARPFMRPAYDAKKDEAIQIIKDECKAIILSEFKLVYK